MVKSELIEAIAANTSCTVDSIHAEKVVNSILNDMSDALASKERIEIRGFGSYNFSQRTEYVARNPKTGERVEMPAKTTVNFRAGKELKNRVNAAIAKM
ncbi:HU family DNA-binding protein [Photobacterium kishitanii]|uniref:Integration host factor subunit beta n=1 Tax=Photobacterium kishitanii TaxID=318456 RepID=A0A2T3KLM5_9GAMM|nr:HU family DNA-binding protein [Photobacterium kishitanii]PSV00591.1 integration host factor subunit beta [Photobacterium kishitanii]